MYQAPRGTVDITPEEQAYWRYIEDTAVHICQLYGYQRIDTPAFEDTGLFTRSVGEQTDIVQKEMYTFDDRGGNSITLRPEGTAPVCRAYLEHGYQNRPQPVKLYYLTSIFRYERPQAGRFRQHHQFGYEAIGDPSPGLDAEVIEMAWRFYSALGLNNLLLKLNSIGCPQCRPAYLETLREYYRSHLDGLCRDCQTRFEKNTLRLLDCKQPTCQAVADAAPRSTDHLCPECAEHFISLTRFLELLELPCTVDHRLVRGLDYYTRTVFEIQPEIEGGQNTIGGGGRYDNLLEELGGKPIPAVGMATGLERVILNLQRQNIEIPPIPSTEVFIAHRGDEALSEAVRQASLLRREGIRCMVITASKSLKAQLRQANSLGVKTVVILGEDEIKNGVATLRDMAGSEQKPVPLAELPRLLR